MLVEGGAVEENLGRAVELVRRGGEQACAVVLLPECLDVGWADPSAQDLAEPVPGARSEQLADAARSAGVAVVAGLTERDGEAVYDAAVAIAADGQLVHVHRKINILHIARHLYAIGNQLAPADLGFATAGVTICADNFHDSQVFAHSLVRMGADLILAPSAWAVEPYHDNSVDPYGRFWFGPFESISSSYRVPVIAASNTGVIGGGAWEGHPVIGASIAYDSDGTLLFQAPYSRSDTSLYVVEPTIREDRPVGTDIGADLLTRGIAPFGYPP